MFKGKLAKVAIPAVAGGLVAVAWTVAGPLDPPAGPVAPTYKTLSEVEPRMTVQSLVGDATALYIISQPGSYYVTGNITGVAGKAGIRIATSGVTLDLMGFTLTGPGVGSQQAGVDVPLVGPNPSTNITIRNGCLRNWTYGVGGSFADGARLEHLSTSGNSDGLRLARGGLITDCVSDGDTNGISTSGHTEVLRCVVRNSIANGIVVNTDQSLVADCLVVNPGNTGIVCGGAGIVNRCAVESAAFYGIQLTSLGGQVRDCTAYGNGLHGIQVFQGTTVEGNTCRLNGGAATDGSGIYATSTDNRIEGNNLIANDRGITTAVAGNLVIRNSASGNSTAYSLFAGTVAGPIVNAANIATSTNPHSNYDF